MTIIFGFVRLVWNLIRLAIVVTLCLSMIFILYKGNQPMQVQAAPRDMTYFEFMVDRIEAAKVIKPSQCGWGMFVTLGVFGPIYSTLYTEIGIHPGGFWDRVSQPDASIPTNVENAAWNEVPGIWWGVVEQISWVTLTYHGGPGCRFRPVQPQNRSYNAR